MPLDVDDDGDSDTEHPHRDLKAEAKSRWHLLVHEPKNPHLCRISKLQHKPARRHSNVVRPRKFGEKITADHVYAHSDQMGGITGDMDVFVIYDLGTDWLGVCPVGSKKVAEAKVALVHFAARLQRL